VCNPNKTITVLVVDTNNNTFTAIYISKNRPVFQEDMFKVLGFINGPSKYPPKYQMEEVSEDPTKDPAAKDKDNPV
jgi:hypothetical protein